MLFLVLYYATGSSANSSKVLPSGLAALGMEESKQLKIFRSVLGEFNALTTRSATSSLCTLPMTRLFSVKLALPVIGSDTRPPGRMMAILKNQTSKPKVRIKGKSTLSHRFDKLTPVGVCVVLD